LQRSQDVAALRASGGWGHDSVLRVPSTPQGHACSCTGWRTGSAAHSAAKWRSSATSPCAMQHATCRTCNVQHATCHVDKRPAGMRTYSVAPTFCLVGCSTPTSAISRLVHSPVWSAQYNGVRSHAQCLLSSTHLVGPSLVMRRSPCDALCSSQVGGVAVRRRLARFHLHRCVA
jgi:hypothetical protein